MIEKIINFILSLFGIKNNSDEIIEKTNTPTEYEKKPLMTIYERRMYNIIKKLENEYTIIPQLNLAAIINKKNNNKYYSELFRNIDFAIFDKELENILLLIEINDKTHNEYKRKDRDLKIKKICNDTGIKLITFYTNYPNEEEYVINRILKEIKNNKQ